MRVCVLIAEAVRLPVCRLQCATKSGHGELGNFAQGAILLKVDDVLEGVYIISKVLEELLPLHFLILNQPEGVLNGSG